MKRFYVSMVNDWRLWPPCRNLVLYKEEAAGCSKHAATTNVFVGPGIWGTQASVAKKIDAPRVAITLCPACTIRLSNKQARKNPWLWCMCSWVDFLWKYSASPCEDKPGRQETFWSASLILVSQISCAKVAILVNATKFNCIFIWESKSKWL